MSKTESLLTRCRLDFEPKSRERGLHYARAKRVAIVRADRTEADATVRGSEGADYALTARVQGSGAAPRLALSCSCPRFADGHFCKHTYALLVVLEAGPQGFEVPGKGRLRLRHTELEPEPGGEDAFYDLGDGDDEDEDEEPASVGSGVAPRGGPSDWQRLRSHARSRPHTIAARELLYVIATKAASSLGALAVQLVRRERGKSGDWQRPRTVSLETWELDSFPEPDRSALNALASCSRSYYDSYRGSLADRELPAGLQALILPVLAHTGRLCVLPPGSSEPTMLRWDPELVPATVRISLAASARKLRLEIQLGGEAELAPESLAFVLEGGLALAGDRLFRLAEPSLVQVVNQIRRGGGPLEFPRTELSDVLGMLGEHAGLAFEGLEEHGWSAAQGVPSPRLQIERPTPHTPATLLYAFVCFEYEGTDLRWNDPRRAISEPTQKHLLRRDTEREIERISELLALGVSPLPMSGTAHDGDVQLTRKRMPELVGALIARGWRVDAQGVPVRRAKSPRLSVRSGVDWFDLEGAVDFDGESASLPQLLVAVARGDAAIQLGDGSLGILPAEWLARVAPLASLGEITEDGVRFRSHQALLLDALLASEPAVDVDRAFREACDRLTRAGEPHPMQVPRDFSGELRAYQETGLGWLHYLGEAGLGACLADDMGLGKTIQVLALLAGHYGANPHKDEHAPSLVVAPKSVVPNWLAEAARFAPSLRVLDFTGSARGAKRDQLAEHDLVVTSYGTLRAEIEKLAGTRFHAVVLDEAQAIKNAAAKTAKAARLLRADRRIALSGTPIENHLGELWSLFDFLNPGLLGDSARSVKVVDDLGDAGVAALACALRPFILRRTKQQVLTELPAKTEQTLFCELEGTQRRLYNELLEHYRARVLKEVDAKGLARSKIHVLEALLRLRQAACHPGLIDKKRAGEGSAKLDLLLEQLAETLDEGHKLLVFSQFTSLLAIVRARLDARDIAYEYLDGKTRDRAERVRRFQEDPACSLFLISLKAGGLGLNLTAADYVFLLDPWWNPAAEAQAVDRAHRIGQTKPVFAYRLVAKDTIEEKILALQAGKRRLADAVISADAGMLRSLTREDLELLLA